MPELPTVMPALPPLVAPPKKIDYLFILVVLILIGFVVFCAYCDNYLGVFIDLILIAVFFSTGYQRYKRVLVLHKNYRTLKALEILCYTPVMRESGNSIILTFLSPSPTLAKEISRIDKESRETKK